MASQEKQTPTIPDGWRPQSHLETFSGHAGPFYFRDPGPIPGVGFFSESHHANLAGVIHGGALMTLADMSLWDIASRKIGTFRGLTVTMNSEFVGPGPIGAFIEATGEVTRAGRKLVFARGLVTSGGEPILSYSGTLKRIG